MASIISSHSHITVTKCHLDSSISGSLHSSNTSNTQKFRISKDSTFATFRPKVLKDMAILSFGSLPIPPKEKKVIHDNHTSVDVPSEMERKFADYSAIEFAFVSGVGEGVICQYRKNDPDVHMPNRGLLPQLIENHTDIDTKQWCGHVTLFAFDGSIDHVLKAAMSYHGSVRIYDITFKPLPLIRLEDYEVIYHPRYPLLVKQPQIDFALMVESMIELV